MEKQDLQRGCALRGLHAGLDGYASQQVLHFSARSPAALGPSCGGVHTEHGVDSGDRYLGPHLALQWLSGGVSEPVLAQCLAPRSSGALGGWTRNLLEGSSKVSIPNTWSLAGLATGLAAPAGRARWFRV